MISEVIDVSVVFLRELVFMGFCKSPECANDSSYNLDLHGVSSAQVESILNQMNVQILSALVDVSATFHIFSCVNNSSLWIK